MHRLVTFLKRTLYHLLIIFVIFYFRNVYNHDFRLDSLLNINRASTGTFKRLSSTIDHENRTVEKRSTIAQISLLQRINNIKINGSRSGRLKVVYTSLDGCIKPDYLEDYRALCYTVQVPQGYV